ncbi:MAG: hypothetical protein JOS17DRAFT_274280 [Linnemannia elongata]|nr:MAG: hypothetical protein JOS17DRAFT_274280 [Linnemannia elongata]
MLHDSLSDPEIRSLDQHEGRHQMRLLIALCCSNWMTQTKDPDYNARQTGSHQLNGTLSSSIVPLQTHMHGGYRPSLIYLKHPTQTKKKSPNLHRHTRQARHTNAYNFHYVLTLGTFLSLSYISSSGHNPNPLSNTHHPHSHPRPRNSSTRQSHRPPSPDNIRKPQRRRPYFHQHLWLP